MRDSKLIQLINQFTTKELEDLESFVFYLNSNKKSDNKLLLLFKHIRNTVPDNLEKEQVFKNLFPDLDFTEHSKKLRDIMASLVKAIENFIVTNRIINNPLKNKIELLDFYKEKKLVKYQKGTQKALEGLMRVPGRITFRDSQYYYYNYFIYDRASKLNDIRKKEKKHNDEIQSAINNLDVFYLIEQLDYYCIVLNKKLIIDSADIEFHNLKILLNEIESSPFYKIPAVAIYCSASKMLSDPHNEKHYTELKKLLIQFHTFSNRLSVQNLFIYAQNFTAWKIQNGKESYYNEYLFLYDFQLKNKIISKIPPSLFKNIVTIILKLGKIDEAETFIEEHIDKIETSVKKEVEKYNFAHLNFSKGKFQQAVDLLTSKVDDTNKVLKFDDLYYQIGSRILLIKSFYELRDVDKIELFCENFKQFIWQKRKIIPKGSFDSNNNFLLIINQIKRLPIEKTERKNLVTKIKDQLSTFQNLKEKEWLVKILDSA